MRSRTSTGRRPGALLVPLLAAFVLIALTAVPAGAQTTPATSTTPAAVLTPAASVTSTGTPNPAPTPTVPLTPTVLPTPVPRWLPPLRVAVVWPHDAQGQLAPAAVARALNVSVWPTSQVGCGSAPDPAVLSPRLMIAQGNEPARFVEGNPRLAARAVGGVAFPSLEWNDLPADPAAGYRLLVYALGVPIGGNFYSNVWTHAADARTLLAQPVVPDDVAPDRLPAEGVDARIQVVWPHDAQGQYAPADRATLVNVAVDLFQHGTRRSLGLDAPGAYTVRLLAAEANAPLGAVDVKIEQLTYAVGAKSYPRWVFDDVPVKPSEQYNFAVSALAVGAKLASPYSTVWTHAADPRTVQPDPPPPPPCVP